MTTSTPRVSIVLSVRNGARFIEQSIDTMLAQTYTDFELIAIDDGSTDSTRDILMACASRDRRIRVIGLDHNCGIPAARNIGTSVARGDLIAVMDADDLNEPTRLELQVGWLDAHPEVDVVGSRYVELVDETGELRQPRVGTHGVRDGVQPAPHSTIVMRRSALDTAGGYDETFQLSSDNELLQRLAGCGSIVHVLEDPLVVVRRHASNVTRNRRLLARNGLRILWRLFRNPNLRPTRTAYAAAGELLVKYVYFTLRLERIVPTSLISRGLGRGPTRYDGTRPDPLTETPSA
jgi:glycosyltransferase involved in cell wall biosynthesis